MALIVLIRPEKSASSERGFVGAGAGRGRCSKCSEERGGAVVARCRSHLSRLLEERGGGHVADGGGMVALHCPAVERWDGAGAHLVAADYVSRKYIRPFPRAATSATSRCAVFRGEMIGN